MTKRRREVFQNFISRCFPLTVLYIPAILCAFYFPPQSLRHPPPNLTVQTLSKELLMTHAVDKASPTDVVTPRTSLNLHSCAGGSPLAPGHCSAGCVDCHYGNGGVHGDEGDDEFDGWGVLDQRSKGSATPEDNFIKQRFRQTLDSLILMKMYASRGVR